MSSVVPENTLVLQKASGWRPGHRRGQSWQHMPGNENQPGKWGRSDLRTRSRGRARDMKAALAGRQRSKTCGQPALLLFLATLRPARAAWEAGPRPGPSTPWPTQLGPSEHSHQGPGESTQPCPSSALLPSSFLPVSIEELREFFKPSTKQKEDLLWTLEQTKWWDFMPMGQ